jgi:ribosome-binding protein aMBF1 (putative translation factor)
MKLIMSQSTKKTSNQFELGVRNFAAWQDLMDQLVTAREDQGLSQKEMGERMGISQSAVAQFELSSANPTISSIVRYANQLGIELVLKTK